MRGDIACWFCGFTLWIPFWNFSFSLSATLAASLCDIYLFYLVNLLLYA